MPEREEANAAITLLIQSKEFKQCISKVNPAHLQDDLASEVYLALVETNPALIIGLQSRNELRFYAVRIIWNMASSNTSPFYHKFRRTNIASYNEEYNGDYSEVITDFPEINTDTLFDECKLKDRKKLELLAFSLIEGLYWYDAMILKLYLVYGDYRSVAKETRIPFTSIYCTAQKAIKEIKEKLAKYDVPKDEEINELIANIERSLKVDITAA